MSSRPMERLEWLIAASAEQQRRMRNDPEYRRKANEMAF